MSSMMRSPCVYIYLPHIYLTDQEGGYTLYDTDASQYIFIPYYGRYIVYWRINEFKWCPVARRLLCPPCIYTYNNNSLPRKKSSYHHRLTHKKTIFLFFFFFSGRAIVNKTRRLMAFLFSPFFLTLHTHTHTRHISVVWNGRSDHQLYHSLPAIMAIRSRGLLAAAFLSRGVGVFIIKGNSQQHLQSQRERATHSNKVTGQMGQQVRQSSLISSGNHFFFFFFFFSPTVSFIIPFFLCRHNFPPISTHTHTQTDTHTLFCSFVLAVFFFSFVSFVTLILQHLNRIRLDGGSQTGRKSSGGRLIRRHCLFWRVDGL